MVLVDDGNAVFRKPFGIGEDTTPLAVFPDDEGGGIGCRVKR